MQLAEMLYGNSAMEMHSHEIAHSLLVCETCCAIGFPGCSDRLTVIREREKDNVMLSSPLPPMSTSSSTSSSSIPGCDLFYDTYSGSPLKISAWRSAFTHLPDCCNAEGAQGPISPLPVRLRKREMKLAYNALLHTTPLDQRPMAVLEAEENALQCRLQFSQCQNVLASAATDIDLERGIVLLTNFILSMHEIPYDVFGCRALEMRVRVCNMMRKKRSSIRELNWSRKIAQKFGVLLRVFNILIAEEMDEEED